MAFCKTIRPSGKRELLVASYGTSSPEGRATIGAIESALEKAFPGYVLRRCFTSQIIIDLIQRREGIAIDNVRQALERASADGVRNLVIQPTHIIGGCEYGKIIKQAAVYPFSTCAIGAPLLNSEEDFQAVADALVSSTAEYDDGATAICLVGHGTEAAGSEAYARLQGKLASRGNYFIGTLKTAPTAEDVLSLVKAGSFKRVLLRPLMLVAGKHAVDDMASSWKRLFESAGYQVVCQLHGLGELEQIQSILVRHAKEALAAEVT